MKSLAISLMLASCAAAPAPRTVESPAPVTIAPAPVQPVVPLLGSTFIRFEQARFYERDILVKGLQNRIDRNAPVKSRTRTNERTYTSGSAAVRFVAQKL